MAPWESNSEAMEDDSYAVSLHADRDNDQSHYNNWVKPSFAFLTRMDIRVTHFFQTPGSPRGDIICAFAFLYVESV